MKLFSCPSCAGIVYFESRSCESCGHQLAYNPETDDMVTLPSAEASPGDAACAAVQARYCANSAHDVCNWVVTSGGAEILCACCRHNHLVPNLSIDGNIVKWRKLEWAKHRLFYSLKRLNLPTETNTERESGGLVFDFVSPEGAADKPVMTGHDNGLITLNIEEADDATRERNRSQLHEPYRTLLGHFRHEIGHYYWDRLILDEGLTADFARVFGDETSDYEAALKSYYEGGPPSDWRDHFISAYASSHPWEDFAETWAHYLHIVDTLEMADSLGIGAAAYSIEKSTVPLQVHFDLRQMPEMDEMVKMWIPIASCLNDLDRCMGVADSYPFVLTAEVIKKLAFIHDLVRGGVGLARSGDPVDGKIATAA